MTSRRNGSARRDEPEFPPIVPEHVYPWRRLADWGVGARGKAALLKAGMPTLRLGNSKFFRGADFIEAMAKQQDNQDG